MLTLFLRGFTMITNENGHNIDINEFLRKSSLEWSRVTPALVVTLPNFRIIRNYNNSK